MATKAIKIKSITKIGKRRTFDLIVPVTNNFFLANGVLSHNSGKSTGMMSMAQKYHDHPDRRYKILGLWGGDRLEQLYWCFPSRDYNYWQKVKKTLRLDKEGPKQYKVNLLYPMSKDLRIKLPKSDYVQSKVFTIPINEVEIEDVSLVIGNTANTHEYFWREAKNKLRKGEGGAHLLEYFDQMSGTNNALYKNFVLPLVNHKLLQGEHCDYNLDLIEEIKDQETITILCLDFIEKEFRLFILGWILRQMANLLDKGKIPTKNIILLQEAAEFFRATDDSIMPDRYKIFRRYLAHYIRMGRRGMHLFMDAQSPRETKGMVDGSQDLTILGKLTSEGDKEDATKQLYKDNLMTKKQIADLSTLNPGEYYIAESGKKVKKRYFLLPRTMYWKKGYGNFYDNVWRNLVGTWHNVSLIKDELEQKFKADKRSIAEEKRQKEEIARRQKEKRDAEKRKQQAEARRIANLEAVRRYRAKVREREKTDLEQTAEEIRNRQEAIEDLKETVGVTDEELAADIGLESVKEETIKTEKDININDKQEQNEEEDNISFD